MQYRDMYIMKKATKRKIRLTISITIAIGAIIMGFTNTTMDFMQKLGITLSAQQSTLTVIILTFLAVAWTFWEIVYWKLKW